jgi:short chain dehydrogenase
MPTKPQIKVLASNWRTKIIFYRKERKGSEENLWFFLCVLCSLCGSLRFVRQSGAGVLSTHDVSYSYQEIMQRNWLGLNGGLSMNLHGQVAIVTGSGRGIGRAIAQELARAGMCVAVVAHTQAEVEETIALIAAEGGTSMGVSTDVTDERAVHEMVARVVQQWGMVDLLVNNAAVGGPFGPSWTVSTS